MLSTSIKSRSDTIWVQCIVTINFHNIYIAILCYAAAIISVPPEQAGKITETLVAAVQAVDKQLHSSVHTPINYFLELFVVPI